MCDWTENLKWHAETCLYWLASDQGKVSPTSLREAVAERVKTTWYSAGLALNHCRTRSRASSTFSVLSLLLGLALCGFPNRLDSSSFRDKRLGGACQPHTKYYCHHKLVKVTPMPLASR